jgi:hypothetical protein
MHPSSGGRGKNRGQQVEAAAKHWQPYAPILRGKREGNIGQARREPKFLCHTVPSSNPLYLF